MPAVSNPDPDPQRHAYALGYADQPGRDPDAGWHAYAYRDALAFLDAHPDRLSQRDAEQHADADDLCPDCGQPLANPDADSYPHWDADEHPEPERHTDPVPGLVDAVRAYIDCNSVDNWHAVLAVVHAHAAQQPAAVADPADEQHAAPDLDALRAERDALYHAWQAATQRYNDAIHATIEFRP